MENTKNNNISVKWHILSKIKHFFTFDKKALNNILDDTDCDDTQKETLFNELNKPETLYNINKIYKFLSTYYGDNLGNDIKIFFNTLLETSMSLEFYLFFMYNYYIRREGIIQKNIHFKENLSSLFYAQDIESLFNKSQFRSHFKRCYLSKDYLDNKIDNQLIAEIEKALPKSDDKLEIAITIYILLCQKLHYSSSYIVEKDSNKITPYWNVNSENNDIVCFTFSIIYFKLLKMYGIDANLSGDDLKHMKVEMRINSMMLEADATNFGRSSESEYKLSDIANVRYGISINGFNLIKLYYKDANYIRYNEKRLAKNILRVQQRVGKKTNALFEISSMIYQRSLHLREQKKNFSLTLEDEIDYQMETMNQVMSYKIENSECENKQLQAKFSHKLFKGYQEYLKKVFLLYKKEKGHTYLFNLYMFEVNEEPIFYLETEGRLTKYSKNSILEEIERRKLKFKDQNALNLISEKLNNNSKLKKKAQ